MGRGIERRTLPFTRSSSGMWDRGPSDRTRPIVSSIKAMPSANRPSAARPCTSDALKGAVNCP
jgi:hypothetical protein